MVNTHGDLFCVQDMAELVEKWYANPKQRPAAELDDDAMFLKEMVWPRLAKEGSKALLVHDSYCCEKQVRRRRRW